MLQARRLHKANQGRSGTEEYGVELLTRCGHGFGQPFTDHAVAIRVDVMAGSGRVLLIVSVGIGLRREVTALAVARAICRAGLRRLRRYCRSHPRPAVRIERCARCLESSF